MPAPRVLSQQQQPSLQLSILRRSRWPPHQSASRRVVFTSSSTTNAYLCARLTLLPVLFPPHPTPVSLRPPTLDQHRRRSSPPPEYLPPPPALHPYALIPSRLRAALVLPHPIPHSTLTHPTQHPLWRLTDTQDCSPRPLPSSAPITIL